MAQSKNLPDLKEEAAFQDKRFLRQIQEGWRDDLYEAAFSPKDYLWKELENCKEPVLIFGCGTGAVLPFARRKKKVTGLDISREAIAWTQKKLQEEGVSEYGSAVLGDVMNAPFPESSFNTIVGFGILHHLNLELACEEIKRLLKKGGKAYFLEPLKYHPIVNMGRWLTPYARTRDEHPFGTKDIEIIRKHFPGAKFKGFHLFSPLAIGLFFHRKTFFWCWKQLESFDHLILKLFPSAFWLTWSMVIEVEKHG